MRSTSRHPPSSVLADLAEGRLPPDGVDDSQAHVAGCARCTAEIESLRRLVELMRSDRDEDAPPPVIAAAVRLFQPQVEPDQLGPIRRLVAMLVGDSPQRPVPLGVRATGGDARRLLFQSEGHDIDLRIAPYGDAWAVSGQVLGQEAAGEAELAGAPGASVRAALDELGEFALPPVPAGQYRLILRLGSLEIETPVLKIGA